jgi:hypothetical protein
MRRGRFLKIAIFLLISFIVCGLLFAWGGEVIPSSEMSKLMELTNQYAIELRNKNYEHFPALLDQIQSVTSSLSPYALPGGEIPAQLEELINALQRHLWTGDDDTREFMVQSYTLYYLLDALVHPYQPMWVKSIRSIEIHDIKETLRAYSIIRPAMALSLDQETMGQFDQYFTSLFAESEIELQQLIETAIKEQEEVQANRTFTISALFLVTITICLGYVAWVKRPYLS